MANEIGEYVNRPKRYDNIDGTVEMGMGAMFFAMALVNCALIILPEGSTWRHGWNSLVLTYAILGPLLAGIHFGGKAIKNRITYKRTGYVALRASSTRMLLEMMAMLLAMLISAGVSVVCVLVMESGPRPESLARLGLSNVLVAIYGLGIAKFISRGNRWKWFVVAGMAIGSLVISSSGGDFERFVLLLFLFCGCSMLASGGISLYLYLRSTQTLAGNANS